MTDRQLTILAALNLMVAVGAGAFGAHGLKRIVSPELLAVWQTGVLYHLIHALGILAVALLGARYGSPLLSAAGLVMFAGIVLFRQPVSARADRHALAGRGHAAGRRRLPGLLGHGCAGRLPQPGLTPGQRAGPCAGALHQALPSYGARNRRDPLLPPMSSAPCLPPVPLPPPPASPV